MGLTLSPQVFAILGQLIEEKTGLHYQPGDMALLADKIGARASEFGFDSLLDYYYYLRYDPGSARELQALVESLVVQETYFFREVEALRVVVRSVLPEVLHKGGRARVWSAACATGEEPYTLAILLAEAGLLSRVEIVASDISERALGRAREGVYSGRSLRALPSERPSPYLLEHVSGSIRVRDDLRAVISWQPVNLTDPSSVRRMGTFDVVLCRNVLIYFSDVTVAAVAASLAEAVRPQGLLVVGASESLMRFGTMFECEERGGSFFYRKPAG